MPRALFSLLLFPLFAIPLLAQDLDRQAADLLARSRLNQYAGDYSCGVSFVRESFVSGADSLSGRMDFRDLEGDRSLSVRGGEEALDWRSGAFGMEQWRRDGGNGRVTRIPPHSLKKPALGPLLSYEDLAKLPFGYLPGFRACRKLSETDSTYELTLLPPAGAPTRYASLEVTLDKRRLLLRRIVFYARPDRPLKSLEVTGYRAESGKYFPEGFRMLSGDGLTSVRATFGSATTVASAPGDNTAAPSSLRVPKAAKWEARDENGDAPADGPIDDPDGTPGIEN